MFAFLAFLNFYSLRINMSLTIVCMVNHTAIRSRDVTTSTNVTKVGGKRGCDGPDTMDPAVNNGSQSNHEDGEFNWDKESQGLIHGSLFWGFIVTNLAGGILATKYGGKHVIGLSLLLAALLTILVPVVSRSSIIGLMVLRFLTGASQIRLNRNKSQRICKHLQPFGRASTGFVSPAMQSMWTHWAPPLESSRLRSFCFAGSQVAKVITYPITAILCEYGFDGGWPSVFYLQGLLGILWYIAWTFMVYNRPAEHPRISTEEKNYIEASLSGIVATDRKVHTPWSSILTSVPVWSIIVAHTCSNWGEYTFLTNMPTYIKEVLNFDIKKNGFLSSVPYLAFWIVITSSSWLADLVRSRQVLSTTATRKVFNSLGNLLPAALLICISFVDCRQSELAITLLTIGISLTGFQYGGGLYMNAGDIAPAYAGVIYGISNTVATIPGFLAPLTIALLTPDQTQEQWKLVFYISAAIYVLGTVFFVAFSDGTLQEWAADRSVLTVPAGDETFIEELNEMKSEGDTDDVEKTDQKIC
ncbi:hypothetical protein Btru_004415 [Bulinus truncatus]|nr:hypothetical protein Btru_004415 [Bulinus truncatus]